MGNGVPIVLLGHHRLKNVNDTTKNPLAFLYAKEQVDNIFTPPPFAHFVTDFNLKKNVIRAKVYPYQTSLTIQTFFRVTSVKPVTSGCKPSLLRLLIKVMGY